VHTVAVTLANWGATAGLNRGVELRFVGSAPAPTWHRSVFGGLAQIIVQSARQAGAIRLTAHASGLRSVTALLESRNVARQPRLP
jgi:hypothetical protein